MMDTVITFNNRQFTRDPWGIWRYPIPTPTPEEECPECGSERIDTDLLPEDDELEDGLFDAWNEVIQDGLFNFPNGTAPDRVASLFTYVHTYSECLSGDCGHTWDSSEEWYYNPIDNKYSLGRPLYPLLNTHIETIYQRQRQIDAGQLELQIEDGE